MHYIQAFLDQVPGHAYPKRLRPARQVPRLFARKRSKHMSLALQAVGRVAVKEAILNYLMSRYMLNNVVSELW